MKMISLVNFKTGQGIELTEGKIYEVDTKYLNKMKDDRGEVWRIPQKVLFVVFRPYKLWQFNENDISHTKNDIA